MLTKGMQFLLLVNWEFAYTLSNDCTLDNTLKMFLVQTSPQNHTYKHILYNSRLVETELCVFCEETNDTILHLFCDCNKVNNIWLKIYVQLHVQCGRVSDLFGRCILLGIENIDFLCKFNFANRKNSYLSVLSSLGYHIGGKWPLNCIGGENVDILASSAADHGFKHSRVKSKTIKLVFIASPHGIEQTLVG
jgi:hypothetical protein